MRVAEDLKGEAPVIIKKYANRRLYNTATSAYVTLDHLSQMVKEKTDFVVYDAKTSEEITRSVLAQIIFDQEGRITYTTDSAEQKAFADEVIACIQKNAQNPAKANVCARSRASMRRHS